MRQQFALLIIFAWLSISGAVSAQERQKTDTPAEDEKVIAVMEILELMEMVDDILLFKDMEYLMEEDQNEPQK